MAYGAEIWTWNKRHKEIKAAERIKKTYIQRHEPNKDITTTATTTTTTTTTTTNNNNNNNNNNNK